MGTLDAKSRHVHMVREVRKDKVIMAGDKIWVIVR